LHYFSFKIIIKKKVKYPKRRKKLVIVAVAKQTWIGLGSSECSTPAISVILCFIKKTERLERKQNTTCQQNIR